MTDRMRFFVFLSILAACDSRDAPKPSGPAPVQAAPAASSPSTARAAEVEPTPKDGVVLDADAILPVGAPSVVRLLETGGEPRTVLRYAIPSGAEEVAELHLGIVVEMKAKGSDLPKQNVPEIILRLELASGADGHVDGTITKLTLEPKTTAEQALAKQMQPTLVGLQGLKLGYTMTPEGRVHDVKLAPGAESSATSRQMLDQLTQSLDSMVVPLPIEPVGVGAVWQVISRLRAGADVLEFAKYRLQKQTGAVLELTSELTQLAASRSMAVPGGSTTGKLESFQSSGTGSVRADLGKLVPQSAKASVHGLVVSTVAGVGSMSVDSTLELAASSVR